MQWKLNNDTWINWVSMHYILQWKLIELPCNNTGWGVWNFMFIGWNWNLLFLMKKGGQYFSEQEGN